MLGATNTRYGSTDVKPIAKELSQEMVGRIWLGVVSFVLVAAWCVLDSWNHDMNGQLSEILTMPESPTGMTGYVLTLAFLMFGFVGLIFLGIFMARCSLTGEDFWLVLRHTSTSMSDSRWSALIVTHTMSSILLQALMMPAHLMSLGLFAATRAVETPTAAAVRANVFNVRSGGHSKTTVMLMFIAAWAIFYSYTQIAECLCVWSGFGVALTGPALYFIYAVLLTVPAANVVYQEAVMVQLQTHPLLMIGVQNISACMLLTPLLLVAHISGLEDVKIALTTLVSRREIVMMVLWMCIQMAAISGVTAGLICVTDSFWTVAARGLRAVFWWYRELAAFYLKTMVSSAYASNYLSIARPSQSVWSFVMLCGVGIGIGALVTDIRESETRKMKEVAGHP